MTKSAFLFVVTGAMMTGAFAQDGGGSTPTPDPGTIVITNSTPAPDGTPQQTVTGIGPNGGSSPDDVETCSGANCFDDITDNIQLGQTPTPAGPGLTQIGPGVGAPGPQGCGGSGDAPAINPSSQHPVVFASGAKRLTHNDFPHAALLGMSMKRTYASETTTGGMFGPHWTSNIEYPDLNVLPPGYSNVNLNYTCTNYGPGTNQGQQCTPNSFIFSLPNGSSYTFYHYNPPVSVGPWVTANGMTTVASTGPVGPGRIVAFWSGVNQITIDVGSLSYIYSNGAPAGTGGYWTPYKISAITQGQGGRTLYTFNRDSNRHLTSITNLEGASVKFGWSGSNVTSVTAPDGRVWSYAYDANGNLTTVTPPNSQDGVYTYYYEDPTNTSRLTGYGVDGVRATTYTYQSDGRVSKVTSTDGDVSDSYVYGTNTTTLTDVRGQVTTYTFTTVMGQALLASTQTTATNSCPSAAASLSYDANGFLSKSVDFDGNVTNYTFNKDGMLLSKTAASGTSVAYTTTNTYTQVSSLDGQDLTRVVGTGADGHGVVQYDYTYTDTSIGRVRTSAKVTDLLTGAAARSVTTTYAAYANGAIQAITNQQTLASGTATTTTSYDTLGNEISVTNAVGLVFGQSNFNGLGLPATVTDPNGVVTTLAYDSRGRPISGATSGVGSWSQSYRGDDNVLSRSTSDGHSINYAYTSYGRLLSATNGLGEVTNYDFTASSNTMVPHSVRNAASWNGSSFNVASVGTFSSTTVFDNQLGTPALTTGQNGQSFAFTYDPLGNLLTGTDAGGRKTTISYDAWSRPLTKALPDAGVIKYSYSASGFLASITDPRSLVTLYAHNGFGDLTSIASPDTGTTKYGFDVGGRPISETRANGKQISYVFDALGRMTSRTSNGTAESFTYDQNTYGKGHLTKFSDASGQTTLAYNAAGMPSQQINTISGSSYTTQWAYDSNSRLSSQTYPNGVVIGYAYDTYGRLSSISQNGVVIIDSLQYQPTSNSPYAWRHANGVARVATLDGDGRLTQLQASGVQNLSYGYNNTNTFASITDAIYSAQNSSFGYDANDRLTGVTRSGDNQSIAYDLVGNRTSSSRAGTSLTLGYGTSNNWMTSVSGGASRALSYDASGNLKSDSTKLFTYDPFDRIASIAVNGATVGTYMNNALGQRVAKTAGGVTTQFVYGTAGELLYETGASPTDYVWLAGQLVGMVRGGVFYAVHTDHVGRPEVVTNAAAQTVWRASNAAFDRTVALDNIGGLNVGFPGQYYDSESGLYQNWHRYYDPSVGRYVQSDPLGLFAGINTYGYGGGNPTSSVDPTGWATAFVWSGAIPTNPFGHLGAATSGNGVSSWGTSNIPQGASLQDYISALGARTTTIVVLPYTTPEQEAALRAAITNGGDIYRTLTNNCAQRGADGASAAGMNVSRGMTPAELMHQVAQMPGAQTFIFGPGETLPPEFGAFNHK